MLDTETINDFFTTPLFYKIMQSIIVILVLIKKRKKAFNYKKMTTYITTVVIFVLILMIWSSMVKSLAIMISIISVGIALALQEVILTIAGWFFIIFKKPYEVGDRIELGDIKGDIIDIDMYNTTVLEIQNWVKSDQSTGRIAKIPNSEVFRKIIYNYTQGWNYIWDEIKLTITFESDYKKAEKILLNIVNGYTEGIEENVKRSIKKLNRKYLIHFNIFTPKVFIKINDSGITLILRYLVDVKERRMVEDKINREFLDKIEKEKNVNLAYNTIRITESK
jgi:small-conductance mechanosensitive channel